MAVSRKPAIAAVTKPNSNSWKCQTTGENAVGRSKVPRGIRIHSTMAKAAQSPAARKKGRKPAERSGQASAEA
jgi:hypothetical protein